MSPVRGPVGPRCLSAWLTLSLLLTACNRPIGKLIEPSAAPSLLAPSAEASVDTAFPAFTWTAVDGAVYYLIAITQDGSASDRQIVSATTTTTQYIPTRQLLLGADYHWQVTAVSADGPGAASASRHFIVAATDRPGPPILDTAGGHALADGAVVAEGDVRVSWRPRAALAANQYYDLDLSVADGGHFTHIDIEWNQLSPRFGFGLRLLDSDTTFDYRLGVDCGETYRWRVRVLSRPPARATSAGPMAGDYATANAFNRGLAVAAGSGWSETWSFRVPALMNAPALTAPADGARVSEGAMQWSALPGAVQYQYEILSAPTDTSGQQRTTVTTSATPFLLGLTAGNEFYAYTLTPGQTYYWRVRATAVSGICYGPWSALRSFVWMGPASRAAGGLPPPPTILPPCGPTCPTNTPGPSPTNTRPPTRTPRPSATSRPVGTATLGAPKTPTPTAAVASATPTLPPLPSATPTAVPATLTPAPPPTGTATSSPVPADTTPPVITKVSPSAATVYYTSGCGPNSFSVSALVTDPAGVGAVTLQYRYRAGAGSPVGKWRSAVMASQGADSFVAVVDVGIASEAYADLSGVDGFIDYVVVAGDKLGNTGGTPESAVSLLYCPG